MHNDIHVDQILDCKGLACPMPIVKTKKAMEFLKAGQVIEVQATDKGSLADIRSWAKNTGHQYLGTAMENEILKHYLRKSLPNETNEQSKFAKTISNEALALIIQVNTNVKVLDVREPAEYAFHRIPGALSIPLGELESRMHELNPNDQIFVVCRSGTRSDLACKLLSERGFQSVNNVVPGMSEWSGPLENY